MPAPKRRRWFSLSLRTLLIGMTVLSVGFAWFLHHRNQRIAERDRLLKEYPQSSSLQMGRIGSGPTIGLEFCDTLLGWELPEPRFSWDATTPVSGGGTALGGWVEDWAWLRPIATPKLSKIIVNSDAGPASWDDLTALARRVPWVVLNGSDDHAQALLPQLLSPATQCLSIDGRFSDLRGAPNLRELFCDYPTAGELETILTHQSLQDVWFDVEPRVLADLPAGPASNLRKLDVIFVWPEGIPEINAGEYAWVQRCQQLQAVDTTACDPAFLAALGRHLGGVETLGLTDFDATTLDQLTSWKRLRHLTLNVDAGENKHILSDQFFITLGQIPSDLASLEIDGGLGDGDTISPVALANLQRFPHLKRLRLDYCELTIEHMNVIAELAELEELSLYSNPLDDKAIQPLKRLRRLRMINLDGTNVSDEEFEKIRGDWIQRPITFFPVVGALP
jgi:hypothetical protein